MGSKGFNSHALWASLGAWVRAIAPPEHSGREFHAGVEVGVSASLVALSAHRYGRF